MASLFTEIAEYYLQTIEDLTHLLPSNKTPKSHRLPTNGDAVPAFELEDLVWRPLLDMRGGKAPSHVYDTEAVTLRCVEYPCACSHQLPTCYHSSGLLPPLFIWLQAGEAALWHASLLEIERC
jgi:hypothetical protein